MNMLSMFQNY